VFFSSSNRCWKCLNLVKKRYTDLNYLPSYNAIFVNHPIMTCFNCLAGPADVESSLHNSAESENEVFQAHRCVQHPSSEPNESTEDTLYLFDDMDIDDDLLDDDGIEDLFGIDMGLGGLSNDTRTNSGYRSASLSGLRGQSVPVGTLVRLILALIFVLRI
jgi:hypothetical protein